MGGPRASNSAVSSARRSGLERTSATGSLQQGPRPLGLGPTGVSQLGVGPAEQQALRVGHRLTVTHQDQHDQAGTRMRPHCSQVATSPGGRARIFSTSTEPSSRWQPSQWLPDQARRTRALEAGPQGLVAVRKGGRQERGLGRPGADRLARAPHRSRPGPRRPAGGAPPPAPRAVRPARAALPARRQWGPAPAWPPARAPRARPGAR